MNFGKSTKRIDMKNKMAIETQFASPDDKFTLSIEDDGEVCYAYLFSGAEIIGVVWLYNRVKTPSSFPNRKRGLPLLNIESAVLENGFEVPKSESDFEATFKVREGVFECAIYCRKKLLAVVGEGDFPGWCMNAKEDCSLALKLSD